MERLLDRLELKPSVMIHDTYLRWVVEVGNRRNIPVASLWTMSAMVFTVSFFYDLLVQNGHVPVDLSGALFFFHFHYCRFFVFFTGFHS